MPKYIREKVKLAKRVRLQKAELTQQEVTDKLRKEGPTHIMK